MEVETHDGREERAILIGMLTDQSVLGRIAVKWGERGLFRSSWGNLIGQWCVDYHNRYRKAPGKAVEGLYEAWAEAAPDRDTVKLVERFLDSLSGEYERQGQESNPCFTIDQAAKYFNRVALERLKDKLQGHLDAGRLEKAQKAVDGYKRVEIGAEAGIDPLRDQEAVKACLDDKQESIVEYPGALGEFFGHSLCRDGLIAFMAPEKGRKSFMLLDLAWRAMPQRRRVAFFEVGDMSQNQIMRRLLVRAARRPIFPKPLRYPLKLEKQPKGEPPLVEYEDREFKGVLSWQEAWKACEEVIKKTRSDECLLRLACYPNSTINVQGVESQLDAWARDGWNCDVLCIDYADILAPMPGGHQQTTRDQTNETWKALRALSQKLHCLVVTCTQADAQSYNADILSRKHFSEDKRKLAHATGIVGINATPSEKEKGLLRLNWIVRREEDYSERRCVYAATCLPIGNPAVRSCW